MTAPAFRTRRPKWLTINLSTGERVGRIVTGAAVVIAGGVLLTAASSVLAVVLELLFVAVGLDLIITGALGHCPLYARLGRTQTTPGSGP